MINIIIIIINHHHHYELSLSSTSLGDMHSTKKVDHKVWFTYGGERSGRFQNLVNKDGSAKTECGIHTEISTDNLNIKK
jgi:phosphoadenosine phosphosulfate reductase